MRNKPKYNYNGVDLNEISMMAHHLCRASYLTPALNMIQRTQSPMLHIFLVSSIDQGVLSWFSLVWLSWKED